MDSKYIKIAGGMAAGVGAVAALPVLGTIGSVSLLGAVLGGTVGGVSGAVLSDDDESRLSAKFSSGVRYGKKAFINAFERAEGNVDIAKAILKPKVPFSRVMGDLFSSDTEKKSSGDDVPVQLHKPEDRLKFLRDKCKELKLNIDDEFLTFMAKKLSGDPEKLTDSLVSVGAYQARFKRGNARV